MSVILLPTDSSEYKRAWKIVRTDYSPDPVIDNPDSYQIISADEDTGECSLEVGGEARTLNFGSGGMKIVARGRA